MCRGNGRPVSTEGVDLVSVMRQERQVEAGNRVMAGSKRPLAVSLAVRVLELEALVNEQSATIEALTVQLAEVGARSGGRWEVWPEEEIDLAPSVRHQRCRGRK